MDSMTMQPSSFKALTTSVAGAVRAKREKLLNQMAGRMACEDLGLAEILDMKEIRADMASEGIRVLD
jgi:hypothetical protein